MFRLFAIVTILFITTDAQWMRILYKKSYEINYNLSSEIIDIKLQKAPPLNNNLPSIRLTNFKNVNYYGIIKIGTPPQEFKVKFVWDTTYLWVFSKKCIIHACSRHNQYDGKNSSTYIPSFRVNIKYDGYNIGGYLSTDTVNVGNLKVKNHTFMEMVYMSHGHVFDAFGEQELDGLFGLLSSELHNNGIMSVLDNMIKQDLVSSYILSFYLNRNTSANLGGALTLGGSNPAYYKGDFTYIPFTNKKELRFIIDSIQISNFTLCERSCQATIDINVWQIVGPRFHIAQINEFIRINNRRGEVDCNRIYQLPTLRFNFNGKAFDLTGKDYTIQHPDNENICITVFSKRDVKRNEIEWILGMPFIRRFYTEIDMEKARVGFALAKKV